MIALHDTVLTALEAAASATGCTMTHRWNDEPFAEMIATVATFKYVFAVGMEVKASNLAEFIALVKGNDRYGFYSSPSQGGSAHLAAEAFARAAGIKMTYVGYKGTANAITDMLGGQLPGMIGNAAENSSAIRFAHHNRMDLALNIVTQASVQIALFVTPVLILLSFPLGHPLDLLFSTFEILAVILAVATLAYAVLNGESNWFEGVQLLALYMMIAVAMYFLPSAAQTAH